MIDVHVHTEDKTELAKFQTQHHITSILNCWSLAELHFNRGLLDAYHYLSGGIHPWQAADRDRLAELPTLLDSVSIAGEIGLDSVWGDAPMEDQLKVFLQQLEYAQKHKKPVILHTKGCEARILQEISARPNRYLIHWYSSPDLIDEYFKVPHAFFSVGPDYFNDPVVHDFAGRVPLDRLFVESDGLGGMSWALDKPKIDLQEYKKQLTAVATDLAERHSIPLEKLTAATESNFARFVNGEIQSQ